MAENIGPKLFMLGKPGIPIMPFMAKFCRLNPRGVPALDCPLAGGKWPLEFASVLEGAICEGSITYALMRSS
jgi:hypothetical protein